MKKLLSVFAKLPPYANTAIVGALILYLTLFPDPLPDNTPPLFPHADKLVHAIMFWALTTAVIYDHYRSRGSNTQKSLLAALAVGVAAGGMIEIAQWLMGVGRSGDLYDLVADATGALVAYATSPRLVKWLLA